MENNILPTPPVEKKTRIKKSVPILTDEAEETAQEKGVEIPEETVTFKRSHFYAALVVLAFAMGIMVGYVAWGRTSVTAAAVSPAGQVVKMPTSQPQYRRYDIPTAGYPSRGPADAKIVIVEFSDFQCPYCRSFHDETFKALLDAYPGQVRFVYRNFPLTSIHPGAMPAAVASLCANDQNAYWDYYERLFSSENLDEATFIKYATELGLNVDTFKTCLSSGSHDAAIKTDMDFSINLGVQSTPTFFVNGLALVGAQPLSNFRQLIDKELAGEIP